MVGDDLHKPRREHGCQHSKGKGGKGHASSERAVRETYDVLAIGLPHRIENPATILQTTHCREMEGGNSYRFARLDGLYKANVGRVGRLTSYFDRAEQGACRGVGKTYLGDCLTKLQPAPIVKVDPVVDGTGRASCED
jgi:hypothetical protein